MTDEQLNAILDVFDEFCGLPEEEEDLAVLKEAILAAFLGA